MKEAELKKWDAKFFLHLWKILPHYCEECLAQGKGEAAYLGDKLTHAYCSHKLVKKRYVCIRWLIRNINILCLSCHRKWETGNREGMKIYNEDELAGLRLLENNLPEPVWLTEDKFLSDIK
jgi:hypothetical protein